MNPKTEELLERTFNFGVDCLKYLDTLPKTKINSVLTYQLAKSSTSMGSNYEEAQAAESSKDFVHKIGIVCKESRESNYWIRVLNEILELSSKDEPFQKLLNESLELKKIFAAIKLSAQNKLKKEK
jgi:four helix bundle protein